MARCRQNISADYCVTGVRRKAHSLTGVPAADLSRIRTADLERFSSDRLMMILNKLGARIEVSVRVKERKLEAVHA
ncbi:MAG: XRE family transcriptional regulator [Nitrospirae bacterium]|nr:XRE family transcriptional regulator [Nitrospirota bacterium]